MVKVICAGYPKTGTKSLHKALDTLGYENIHDYLEHVDLYMDDYLDVLEGRKQVRHILDKYVVNKCDCLLDMPPCFLFESFFNRWPDVKVILTVRDEDAWFKSIKKMNDSLVASNYWFVYFSSTAAKYNYYMRTLYCRMFGSGTEIEWLWKLHYRKHNNYVKTRIPKENLLVYNVSDGWKPLCEFLEKEVPDEKFPLVNVAGSKGNILERILNESKMASRARKEIIFSVVGGSVLIGACGYAGWCYYKNNY